MNENSLQLESDKSMLKSVELLSAQITLNNAIFLLSNVDFSLISTIIANTPADMQENVQYQVLVLSQKYYSDLVEMYKKYAPEKPEQD